MVLRLGRVGTLASGLVMWSARMFSVTQHSPAQQGAVQLRKVVSGSKYLQASLEML
jgi:hypothetical protein